MSGGGSNNNNSTKKPTVAAPATGGSYPGAGVPYDMPQAVPGQLEALSAQLGDGFGGTQQTLMGYLDQLYSPMSILGFPQPGTGTGKPVAPKAGGDNPSPSRPIPRPSSRAAPKKVTRPRYVPR